MGPNRKDDGEATDSEVTRNALEQLSVVKDESQIIPITEDIDPAEWLAQASGLVTQRLEVRPGKYLLVAALTEKEVNGLLKASERPDPRNPRVSKPDLQRFRRNIVAFSINKASGKQPADPGYMDPDRLLDAFAGHLTEVQNKIMEVSGFKKAATEEVEGFFV